MLKIKLFRTGKRKQPKFRIVVAEARSKSDGKYIANLGHYDPLENQESVKLDKEKYNYWLAKGAQPTRSVRLLVEKL